MMSKIVFIATIKYTTVIILFNLLQYYKLIHLLFRVRPTFIVAEGIIIFQYHDKLTVFART